MSAIVGQAAPNLDISEWVQGAPTNIDKEKDHIVLVEVFQVNCPGCFMYAIPEAISIYQKYRDDGVRVWGVATAFEDFDKNTIENLRLLLESGQVIGDTLDGLGKYGKLIDGNCLPFKIPFPVAADLLQRADASSITPQKIREFILSQIPDFDQMPQEQKDGMINRVKVHMSSKEYSAATFEKYQLRGTPSSIIVDRAGILRDVSFGQDAGGPRLESIIRKLIDER